MRKNTGTTPAAKAPEAPAVGLSLLDAQRRDFSQRLVQHLKRLDWNQSELARRIGMGRDSVSNYISGKQLPEKLTLMKIADAFGVEPDDMLPNAVVPVTPTIQLIEVQNRPGRTHLILNTELSSDTAMAIYRLVRSDNISPR